MNYIGMDTHISTLDFAVVNEAGQLIKANSVATSVNGFMEFVKTVPPPRAIYMEEGTLAAWVLETCVRFSREACDYRCQEKPLDRLFRTKG